MITHSPSGDTSPLSRNETVGIRSKPVPSVLIRASALPSCQRPEDQLSGRAERHLITGVDDQAGWGAPVERRQPNLRLSISVRRREGHLLLVARNRVLQ